MYIELHCSGLVRTVGTLEPEHHTTVLAAQSDFLEGYRIYSSSGELLKVEFCPAVPARSWWRVLLAKTVYNPLRSYAVSYQKVGEWQLVEVKERIRSLIDADDDILTQFLTAEAVDEELRRASTFEELVHLVRRMEGAVIHEDAR